MNNEIEEDYCSFEVSELLHGKEFLLPYITTFRVTKDCGEYPWQKEGVFLDENMHLDEACCPNHGVDGKLLIQCPTHALAIKWIRENFGVYPVTHIHHTQVNKWYYEISYLRTHKDHANKVVMNMWYKGEPFDTFERATEAALLHTLTKLI